MAQQFIKRLINFAFAISVLTTLSAAALAQGFPANSALSDIKPGSVLFFNRYTSNPNNPQFGDTQINITNVSQNSEASIHLFFIDGATCTIVDAGMGLTPNQTATFLASEFDPGIQGYLIVVANDGSTPTQFNFLAGVSYIRENDGRQGTLPAISIAKRSPGPILPKEDGSYSLRFNGADYEQLPNSLAVTSFNSQVTDSSYLTIYSPSRDLTLGTVETVSIFSLVFDDQEKSISSSFTVSCYRSDSLLTLFNRGVGLNRHVPSGSTGWIRMTATGRPILGSLISKGQVFGGGYNLHALSVLASYEIALPVF